MPKETVGRGSYALLVLAMVATLISVAYATTNGNIDPQAKWAWSKNVGWANFDPDTHGGVTVYTDHLEGYVWAENVGWMRLGSYSGGGPRPYDNDAAGTYGVNKDGAGNLSGYAWSTNVGWINFDPDNHGGVTVYGDHLEGYAWAENVGWMRLGRYEGGGAHTYANDAADSYGVNNDGAGKLSGYAWSKNVGWINFDPQGDRRVTIDATTGRFQGYAWSENVGWIRLGSYDGGASHTYANDAVDSYGVNNDGSGNLSGNAWSKNVGWIDFDPDGDERVTIDPLTGSFDGYAWGENVGWIHFKGTGAQPYNVVTTWRWAKVGGQTEPMSLLKSIWPWVLAVAVVTMAVLLARSFRWWTGSTASYANKRGVAPDDTARRDGA